MNNAIRLTTPYNRGRIHGSISVFVLGLCAVVAFVLGALAMPVLSRVASEGMADLTDKVGLLSSQRDANLIAKFKATDWSQNEPSGLEEIAAGMQSSAPLRELVLQSFQDTSGSSQRYHFAQLLRAAPMPDLPAKALQWAKDAQNVKARVNGFTLLSDQQHTPEITALFLGAIQSEQESEVLARVLYGLQRNDAPEPRLVGQLVPRLHQLTSHPTSEVRQASIQRLAEWDRALSFFPNDVLRLLSDPQPDVRVAAIGATSLSTLTSEPLKKRLLEIFSDTKEDLEVRNVALLNIGRFDFTDTEYTIYKTALAQFENAAEAANSSSSR